MYSLLGIQSVGKALLLYLFWPKAFDWVYKRTGLLVGYRERGFSSKLYERTGSPVRLVI